jgi:hypothetical protein
LAENLQPSAFKINPHALFADLLLPMVTKQVRKPQPLIYIMVTDNAGVPQFLCLPSPNKLPEFTTGMHV